MIGELKMLNSDNKQLIKRFRTFLDRSCYDLLAQSINSSYFINPLPDYESIKKAIKLLPPKQKHLIQLLYLGDKVSYQQIISYFGTDLINTLVELGICKNEDNEFLQTNGLILIPYLENYFFVGVPYYFPHCLNKDPDVYIGMDTYKLTSGLLSYKCNKVLDLCSGSGIQIIMGCQKSGAKTGIGVEYNSSTCSVAQFNVILNNMEDVIEIHNASLYESVYSDSFDIIYSNPPFIPVPDGIKYPICGDGGENGLSIVKQIIEGYASHLNQNGYGVMIGEAFASKDHIFLSDIINDSLSTNFVTTLLLLNNLDIKNVLKRITHLTHIIENHSEESLKQKWLELYDRLSITDYYSFYLKCRKTNEKSLFEVVDISSKWKRSDKPQITSEYKIKKNYTVHELSAKEYDPLMITDVGLQFLEECGYSLTIEQIADKIISKNVLLGKTDKDKIIENILSLCDTLESHDIIRK